MSQRKPQFYESKYQRNAIYSRSSEPINRFQNRMYTTNPSGHYSTTRLFKQAESSLLKENQAFYKCKYILEDYPDDSNTVFFDSNLRKFRNRSSTKQHNLKNFANNYNNISVFKYGKNDQKYEDERDYMSPTRNNLKSYNDRGFNNEQGENISSKINFLKINEKIIVNPQEGEQILNQMNRENDNLMGKSKTNMISQQSQNSLYISNNNNISNIYKNPNSNYFDKFPNINQQTPWKENEEYSSNQDLYYNMPKSNLRSRNDYNNPSANKEMNFSEENPKIETSQRTEERTLILVPGQTIEKTSMVENFDNPTEEIIENPDGTVSSIIKQTKVTTITENTPIEIDKIQSIEGAPELPMYKQKMTHIYQTVTSIKQKSNQPSPNKITYEIKTNLNQGINPGNNNEFSYKDKNYCDIDDIKEDKEEMINTGSEEEKDKNFDSKMLTKGFKNEQELEKFLDDLNQKVDNISPQEKEKRFNHIKDIFNSISKGKSSEDNIEKLAQFLANMSEKDKKEILEKLGKEPKNKNLLNKLNNLNKRHVEQQEAKNSLNKNSNEYGYNKEGLSSSQKKASNMKSLRSENVEPKEINPLKFEGLFLEMTKYGNEVRERNPFDGPSPYTKFYRERRDKIKQKINNNLASDDIDQNEKNDIIKEENL